MFFHVYELSIIHPDDLPSHYLQVLAALSYMNEHMILDNRYQQQAPSLCSQTPQLAGDIMQSTSHQPFRAMPVRSPWTMRYHA